MVKCDATKQVVTYGEPVKVESKGKSKKVRPILSEKFVPCSNERQSIIQTSLGRVGLCPGHLEHYQELDQAAKKAYFRMRHGKIVADEPQEDPVTA